MSGWRSAALESAALGLDLQVSEPRLHEPDNLLPKGPPEQARWEAVHRLSLFDPGSALVGIEVPDVDHGEPEGAARPPEDVGRARRRSNLGFGGAKKLRSLVIAF